MSGWADTGLWEAGGADSEWWGHSGRKLFLPGSLRSIAFDPRPGVQSWEQVWMDRIPVLQKVRVFGSGGGCVFVSLTTISSVEDSKCIV